MAKASIISVKFEMLACKNYNFYCAVHILVLIFLVAWRYSTVCVVHLGLIPACDILRSSNITHRFEAHGILVNFEILLMFFISNGHRNHPISYTNSSSRNRIPCTFSLIRFLWLDIIIDLANHQDVRTRICYSIFHKHYAQ